jgi:hypothetical protein
MKRFFLRSEEAPQIQRQDIAQVTLRSTRGPRLRKDEKDRIGFIYNLKIIRRSNKGTCLTFRRGKRFQKGEEEKICWQEKGA